MSKSKRNQPKQFANGVGVYSPWAKLDPNVKAAQTRQAATRKYSYSNKFQKETVFIRPTQDWKEVKPVFAPGV